MKRILCCLISILFLSLGSPIAAPADEAPYTYGIWAPDWQINAALYDLDSLPVPFEKVIAFACIFDLHDQPLMLTCTEKLLFTLQDRFAGTDTEVYLSVVNDIEVEPEEYDYKNSELLFRLFADEDTMRSHIKELAGLIARYHLTGIEIDYEYFYDTPDFWNRYAVFIAKVWEMCQQEEAKLRVVLTSEAAQYIELPPGPEYSVMCYNLYGDHSGPGPKADLAYLQDTCALYQPYIPDIRMAFATGGFDWNGDHVNALTQWEAEEQLHKAGITPERDPESGALHCLYSMDNTTHEVWYADAETLSIWRDVCAAYGYTAFDFFRLGDINVEDWETVLLSKQP